MRKCNAKTREWEKRQSIFHENTNMHTHAHIPHTLTMPRLGAGNTNPQPFHPAISTLQVHALPKPIV